MAKTLLLLLLLLLPKGVETTQQQQQQQQHQQQLLQLQQQQQPSTSAYENANFTWEKQAAGDDNLLLLCPLLTQNSCKVVAELINLQLAAVAFVKMPPNAYFDVVAAAAAAVAVVALKQTIRIGNERNKIEI
ncbi:GM17575 [Drosophila sechellia]|uniref:GM17575 n=1 Tax=Drosophila sechellia TaxID=7238 RepID=B4IG88_DROSE|nr:GM17575 [Drosophila sechellia]